MKLEHLALNVEDPVAMAAWYVWRNGSRETKAMVTGVRAIIRLAHLAGIRLPAFRISKPLNKPLK